MSVETETKRHKQLTSSETKHLTRHVDDDDDDDDDGGGGGGGDDHTKSDPAREKAAARVQTMMDVRYG